MAMVLDYSLTVQLFFCQGSMHLAGIFSKLPQGLVSLSLADNGITSKGTCTIMIHLPIFNCVLDVVN